MSATVSQGKKVRRVAQEIPPTSINGPATGDLLVEGSPSSSKWQFMPPIVTAQLLSVSPTAPADINARGEAPGQLAKAPQLLPDTDHPALVQPAHAGQELPARKIPTVGDSLVGMDPFAWWTSTTQGLPQEPGTFSATAQGSQSRLRRSPVRLANTRGRQQAVRQVGVIFQVAIQVRSTILIGAQHLAVYLET